MERILSALIYQLDQIRVFGEDRQRMTSCIKTLQDILDALRKGPPANEHEKAMERSNAQESTSQKPSTHGLEKQG